MLSRDRDEQHRATSPLELFFDLVFAVAVAQAADTLHEGLVSGPGGTAVFGYAMVFFAVWWAWMNFTWFASAFDTDDWLYRVMTVVQMGGVLILAAGVHDAMVHYDFTAVTAGYVVMRLAMVAQWVRAGVSDPAVRRTAFTYAVGIAVVQVLWVARLALPGTVLPLVGFLVLVAAELAVPAVAERRGVTAWHPAHIADRYGCFTLILLGESVLASAGAVFAARGSGVHVMVLALLAAAGLALAAGLWWVYFLHEQGEHLARSGRSFSYGYVHYVVFAAAGAVSAGIALAVDAASGRSEVPAVAAAFVLTVPVGVFLLSTWFVLLRGVVSPAASVAVIVLSLVIVAAALVPPVTVVATVVLVAVVVAVLELDRTRRSTVLDR